MNTQRITIGKTELEVSVYRDKEDANVYYADIKGEKVEGNAIWNMKYEVPMVRYLKKADDALVERRVERKSRVLKITGATLAATNVWFREAFKAYSAAKKAGKVKAEHELEQLSGQLSMLS